MGTGVGRLFLNTEAPFFKHRGTETQREWVGESLVPSAQYRQIDSHNFLGSSCPDWAGVRGRGEATGCEAPS